MEKMCGRCQLAMLEILTWIDFDIDTGCWHFLPQAPSGAEYSARYSAWTAWRCGDLIDDIAVPDDLSCVTFGECINPEHFYASMEFLDQRNYLALPVGA